jgi:hypothetical protein
MRTGIIDRVVVIAQVHYQHLPVTGADWAHFAGRQTAGTANNDRQR